MTPPKNINWAERCRPLTPSLSDSAKWFLQLLKDHPCRLDRNTEQNTLLELTDAQTENNGISLLMIVITNHRIQTNELLWLLLLYYKVHLPPENNPGENQRLIELFITQGRFIQDRLTWRGRPNRDYINRRAASASGSVLLARTERQFAIVRASD